MNKPTDSTIRKRLGENIRLLRMSRGYNQTQFAQLLGATQAAVSSWESGKREPELWIIFDIANQFHVSVSSLIPFEQSRVEEDTYRAVADLAQSKPEWVHAFKQARYLSANDTSLVISLIKSLSKGDSE